MIVSIIIPVYNEEKYLIRCIESVVNQTYKEIEIILVDDGSTDKSGIICDKIAQKDDRVVVIHKKNEGLSSARNIGIENANGKYITFIDSDDYLNVNFVEKTVELCEKNNAQISIMKMMFVGEKYNEEIQKKSLNKEQIFSSEEAIKESLYQRLFSCCAPGKTYLRELFDDIKFPIGRISEDLAICHLVFDKTRRIVYSDEIGYYYRQHPKSIMHTFSEKRLDALEWAKKIEEYCSIYHPNLKEASECRTFNIAVHLTIEHPSDLAKDTNMYSIIWGNIIRTRRSVIKNREARKKERIAAILSYGGDKMLKSTWKVITFWKKR